MSKKEELENFLLKIDPYIQQLTLDFLIKKPDNICDFGKNWFLTKGMSIQIGHRQTLSIEEQQMRQTLNTFRELKSKINQEHIDNTYTTHKKSSTIVKFKQQPSTEDLIENLNVTSEEDDELQDELDDQFVEDMHMTNHYRSSRASISSEAFGSYNFKKKFEPQVIEKTFETKVRLMNILNKAFMFSCLENKEKQIVINAMQEVNAEANQKIIQEGDEGAVLYIVDSGVLECFIRRAKEDKIIEELVKVYEAGSVFGELALLYNVPRKASIISKTSCVLFSLDRECFNHIVRDAAAIRRQKFDQVLQNIDLLADMDAYERAQLYDGLQIQQFIKGEKIVQQGTKGDLFYIVEHGTLEASKEIDGNNIQKGNQETVYEYEEGGYFGELALINDIPRQATITATSDGSLIYLNRDVFKRLLGPIEDLLKRNCKKYKAYLQN